MTPSPKVTLKTSPESIPKSLIFLGIRQEDTFTAATTVCVETAHSPSFSPGTAGAPGAWPRGTGPRPRAPPPSCTCGREEPESRVRASGRGAALSPRVWLGTEQTSTGRRRGVASKASTPAANYGCHRELNFPSLLYTVFLRMRAEARARCVQPCGTSERARCSHRCVRRPSRCPLGAQAAAGVLEPAGSEGHGGRELLSSTTRRPPRASVQTRATPGAAPPPRPAPPRLHRPAPLPCGPHPDRTADLHRSLSGARVQPQPSPRPCREGSRGTDPTSKCRAHWTTTTVQLLGKIYECTLCSWTWSWFLE